MPISVTVLVETYLGIFSRVNNTGRGVMDIPKIFKSLKNIGYENAVDVECDMGNVSYPLSRQTWTCCRGKRLPSQMSSRVESGH